MQATLLKNKNYFFIAFAAIFLSALAVGIALNMPYLYIAPLGLICALALVIDIRNSYWILLCSLPISVNLLEFNGPSIDLPDEPLLLILTITFPFLFLQNCKTYWAKNIFRNGIIGLLILWYLWMIVCTINSTFPILSLKFIVAKLWYYIPFILITSLIVFDDENSLKKMYLAFVPIAVFTIGIVLFRHYQIGFSFEKVNEAGAPVFRNHVGFGSFISMVIPILGIGIWLTKKFSLKWWLQIIGMMICVTALYFAYSRGAWAAILFASAIWLGIRIKKAHWFITLFYASLLGITLWLGQNNRYIDYAPDSTKGIMHKGLVDHLVATIRGKDISSNERFYRWVAAARLSSDYPIAGTGPNTFFEQYKKYRVTNFRTYVSRNKEHSTTHNYFLFSLVEQGYPGMILYASFIWIVFFFGQRVYNQFNDIRNKTIIAGIIAMLAAFFINNCLSELLEHDKLAGMFFIGIGILIGLEMKKSSSDQKSLL
jgi:O-antigen ligase